MKRNYELKKAALDLLFPGRCPVCDGIVGFGRGDICQPCMEKVKLIRGPACMKCGKPVTEEEEYCHDCSRKKHVYQCGMAAFEYKSVAPAIYRFKYKGRQEYAVFFGRCMAKKLEEKFIQWKPEALMPVPVHPSRKRQRGYNQAELLAWEVSARTGVPVYSNIVKRWKKTAPQKDLDDIQRQNNLKRAFKIDINDVKLNTIVIIDDIYTTGSTIDAMAGILHKAGIPKVYFMALTIGRGI